MPFTIVALILLAALMAADVAAETDDERLVDMFSPILVLVEDTGGKWGDIRVTKPEPVEIVGANSAGNIWFEAWELGGISGGTEEDTLGTPSSGPTFVASAPLDSSFWLPSLYRYDTVWYSNVDFVRSRFAFLDHGSRVYPSVGGGLDPGQYLVRAFGFEYPGITPAEWNDAYFGKGRYAGKKFLNTAYIQNNKQ